MKPESAEQVGRIHARLEELAAHALSRGRRGVSRTVPPPGSAVMPRSEVHHLRTE